MIEMTERQDPIPYSPTQFFIDLKTAAEAIQAPFNPESVQEMLRVFDDEFRRCVVQLKATCRPDAGIYYRFFYKWDRDLTQLAIDHGLIARSEGPIVDLQQQVLSSCSGATRAGIDFETNFGLAKIWTFTGGPTSLNELTELPAIPQSVRDSQAFLKDAGLNHVFFVASDFQQNSMNVYFGLDESCRNEDWLRNLIHKTGGGPEDPTLYQRMLNSLAVSTGVGTTFRWDRPEMGRWCLYGLNVPFEAPNPAFELPPLPNRLKRFQQQAPSLNVSPQYNIAWSFGKAGYYTKLEKSYSKDADYFLTCEMGGNLSHPEPIT